MKQQLFGGAMEISSLPDSFVDVSNFREVPDNQEVFAKLQEGSGEETTKALGSINPSPLSLIIELLDFDTSGDDPSVVIFQDLSESNEARASNIVTKSRPVDILENIPELAANVSKRKIHGIECLKSVGVQRVPSKALRNQSAEDIVMILLAVIRLPSVRTDISLSVNAPLRTVLSESLQSFDFSEEDAQTQQEAEDLLSSTLKCFQIKDWGLFV
jgi:hypothetical protein